MYAENAIEKEKEVTTQQHVNSCGAMALSQLLSAMGDKKVSEQEVIDSIRSISGNEKEDYSIGELEAAAHKLGFTTQAAKVPPDVLPNLNQPVVLLIGLNMEGFNHFVVLKGIISNVVYLYDPIRKHVRVPYSVLKGQSINKKHPLFYVLAVKGSLDSIKKTSLYLSESEAERNKAHYTEEQANALTLVSLSKKNQVIIDYGVNILSDKKSYWGAKIESRRIIHNLNVRYGITDDTQIGGNIQYSNVRDKLSFHQANAGSFIDHYSDTQYNLYTNHRSNFDDLSLILGLNASFSEKDNIWGGTINASLSKNFEFAQVIFGGSIGKEFSKDHFTNSLLPDYSYSVFFGANKPFFNRYLASLNFSLSDAIGRDTSELMGQSYTLSTGLTYVFNRNFQINPSLSYSFGKSESYSFGLNLAYTGDW